MIFGFFMCVCTFVIGFFVGARAGEKKANEIFASAKAEMAKALSPKDETKSPK
jgi:hypothetical protein